MSFDCVPMPLLSARYLYMQPVLFISGIANLYECDAQCVQVR